MAITQSDDNIHVLTSIYRVKIWQVMLDDRGGSRVLLGVGYGL